MAAQRRVSSEAQRGIRSGSREVTAQSKVFEREAAQGDAQRAQQTADELLRELEQIEHSLDEQRRLRQKA